VSKFHNDKTMSLYDSMHRTQRGRNTLNEFLGMDRCKSSVNFLHAQKASPKKDTKVIHESYFFTEVYIAVMRFRGNNAKTATRKFKNALQICLL